MAILQNTVLLLIAMLAISTLSSIDATGAAEIAAAASRSGAETGPRVLFPPPSGEKKPSGLKSDGKASNVKRALANSKVTKFSFPAPSAPPSDQKKPPKDAKNSKISKFSFPAPSAPPSDQKKPPKNVKNSKITKFSFPAPSAPPSDQKKPPNDVKNSKITKFSFPPPSGQEKPPSVANDIKRSPTKV